MKKIDSYSLIHIEYNIIRILMDIIIAIASLLLQNKHTLGLTSWEGKQSVVVAASKVVTDSDQK